MYSEPKGTLLSSFMALVKNSYIRVIEAAEIQNSEICTQLPAVELAFCASLLL